MKTFFLILGLLTATINLSGEGFPGLIALNKAAEGAGASEATTSAQTTSENPNPETDTTTLNPGSARRGTTAFLTIPETGTHVGGTEKSSRRDSRLPEATSFEEPNLAPPPSSSTEELDTEELGAEEPIRSTPPPKKTELSTAPFDNRLGHLPPKDATSTFVDLPPETLPDTTPQPLLREEPSSGPVAKIPLPTPSQDERSEWSELDRAIFDAEIAIEEQEALKKAKDLKKELAEAEKDLNKQRAELEKIGQAAFRKTQDLKLGVNVSFSSENPLGKHILELKNKIAEQETVLRGLQVYKGNAVNAEARTVIDAVKELAKQEMFPEQERRTIPLPELLEDNGKTKATPDFTSGKKEPIIEKTGFFSNLFSDYRSNKKIQEAKDRKRDLEREAKKIEDLKSQIHQLEEERDSRLAATVAKNQTLNKERIDLENKLLSEGTDRSKLKSAFREYDNKHEKGFFARKADQFSDWNLSRKIENLKKEQKQKLKQSKQKSPRHKGFR